MYKKFMRRVLCLFATLCLCLDAGAVLKEKNLASPLSVRRAALETAVSEQRQNIAR